jgi:hypothetical protein
MIIDFHTHIFPDKIAKQTIEKLSEGSNTTPFSDGSADGLQASMKKAGVDLSVVLPVVTNPAKASHMNQYAARLNEHTEETGLLSFGGIHPDTPDYKAVLREAVSLGLKGIKLHPDYYRIAFDDIRTMRIVDYASELGLLIVTHAGVDIGLYPPVYCSVEAIRKVLKEVQPEKLVLAHMGGWQLWNQVTEELAGQNVYLDTAFSIGELSWVKAEKKKDFRMLTDEEFIKMVRVFGSERILFATDSPWSDQRDYIQRIEQMPLSREEKENIFCGNARRLLG